MRLKTRWGKLSSTVQYSLYGALFGLMFPVFATLGDLYVQQLPFTLASFLQVQQSNVLHWVIDTAPFFLGLFASFAGRRQDQLAVLNQELNRQVRDRDRIIGDLRVLQDSLGVRSKYLAAITEVAQSAASAADNFQAFVARAVVLVGEHLGFDHVGIFVLDDTGAWAVLRAASSEGGQRMLAQGYRLRAGQEGLVGYVLAEGKSRVVLDVHADAALGVAPASPTLPDARSEMAFPLRVGGEIIGVLDVQNAEPEAFSEEDIAVVQVMADLIAVAINSARFSQQVQDSLQAMRRAYGEMGLDVWREILRTRSLGERYDPAGILPPEGELAKQARQAVQDAKTVLDNTGAAALATPIRIRGGQVVGVLDARKPNGAGAWTPQEVELMGSLVEQLGVALDGARLYQDSQERAERERVIGELSSRMRESLSIDAMLQTAIREIGETLGIDEVEVRMRGKVPSAEDARRDDGGEAN